MARGRKALRRTLALTLTSIVFFALGDCSLDYSGATEADQLAENTPNSVLIQFEHTIVKNGKPQFRLTASRAENYDSRNQTLLSDVGFIEFDDQGAIVTKGTATSAVYHTDTENVELSGVIDFHSNRDGLEVKAGYLAWDNDKKELTSRNDQIVTITKDNGSVIRGSGFEGNGQTREYQFAQGVEGSWVTDSAEEPAK